MAEACQKGPLKRVRELLEFGVRADGSEGGRSFLWIACESGQSDVVVALLRAGAKATNLDLRAAVRSGSVDAAGRIVDELELTGVEYDFWGEDRPLLCDPTFLSTTNPAMVKLLLDHGADPTERDRTGRDALAVAAKAGASAEIVALLRR